MQWSTGSVKGFAQTLALGIVLSMFTALVISRLLIKSFYALGFKDEKYYGKAKTRKSINFVGKWHVHAAIMLVVLLSGPVAMGINSRSRKWYPQPEHGFPVGTSTSVTF